MQKLDSFWGGGGGREWNWERWVDVCLDIGGGYVDTSFYREMYANLA